MSQARNKMTEEKNKTEGVSENEESFNENVGDSSSVKKSGGGMGILADVLAERPKLPVGRQLALVLLLLFGVFSLGAALYQKKQATEFVFSVPGILKCIAER